jgi:hypothetical protein
MRDERNDSAFESSDRADRHEGAIDAAKARERIGTAKPEAERSASGAGTSSTRADDLESSLRDEGSGERGEVL